MAASVFDDKSRKPSASELDDVLEYFRATHTELMALAESLTDEETLIPDYYAFTGGGSFYDWLNAYAAHDLWGKRRIREWMRMQAGGK